LAKDHLSRQGIKVIGGVISPVSDEYGKKNLIPAEHRLKMVELAIENYSLVKCSSWETQQDKWTRTRPVMDEYSKQVFFEKKLHLSFLIFLFLDCSSSYAQARLASRSQGWHHSQNVFTLWW
jgi:nicotinamide mononucleotide adenylyltransferase